MDKWGKGDLHDRSGKLIAHPDGQEQAVAYAFREARKIDSKYGLNENGGVASIYNVSSIFNEDLRNDIEGILNNKGIPKLRKEYDNNESSERYVLMVADGTYFYAREEDRNLDYNQVEQFIDEKILTDDGTSLSTGGGISSEHAEKTRVGTYKGINAVKGNVVKEYTATNGTNIELVATSDRDSSTGITWNIAINGRGLWSTNDRTKAYDFYESEIEKYKGGSMATGGQINFLKRGDGVEILLNKGEPTYKGFIRDISGEELIVKEENGATSNAYIDNIISLNGNKVLSVRKDENDNVYVTTQGFFLKGGTNEERTEKEAAKQAKQDISREYYKPGDPVDFTKPSEHWRKYALPYDTKFTSEDEFAKGGNLKEFEIYKNGTQEGTVWAKNKKEAEGKVFAAYGEHRQVSEVEKKSFEDWWEEGGQETADSKYGKFVTKALLKKQPSYPNEANAYSEALWNLAKKDKAHEKYAKGGRSKVTIIAEDGDKLTVTPSGKATHFDIRISKKEAERLLSEELVNDDKFGAIMCKEYGDDEDWQSVTTDDLEFDEGEVGSLDSDYKTFEISLRELAKIKKAKGGKADSYESGDFIPGVTIKAKRSIPYIMGQDPKSDKIFSGEEVTVESNENGSLQFKEVPNQYGPFDSEDFKWVSSGNKGLKNIKLIERYAATVIAPEGELTDEQISRGAISWMKAKKEFEGGGELDAVDEITSYRDIPYNEVTEYANTKALNTDSEENYKEAAQMLFDEKYADKVSEEYKKGGKTQTFKKCPIGTQIQSLILDKEYFPTERSAKTWAHKHKFKHGDVDSTEKTFRLRQHEPNTYRKRSFRTIILAKGIKAVLGCPIKSSTSVKSKLKK